MSLATIWTWILYKLNLVITSGWPLIFWVQPRWFVAQIPSQHGKVILVTGANAGIGLVTAQELYKAGAKVYLACRSETKAREAMAVLTKSPGGSVEFVQLDLADLESVRRAASIVREKESRLDVLICNAGIMATTEGQYTKQGYTLQFGSNVLGHQVLISQLLPILLGPRDDPARVITLSSAGHDQAPANGVDYSSIVRGGRELNRWAEYGQSKWGDITLSKYLDAVYGREASLPERRVADGELINFSIHPGLVNTNLADHLGPAQWLRSYAPWVLHAVVRSAMVGAGNQLWAATMPLEDARRLSGSYIVPYQRIGRPRPDTLVLANQVRLWEWCEKA